MNTHTQRQDRYYPIAETFLSIQGEGLYAGTVMYFIRFAGCNVGRAPTTDDLVEFKPGKVGAVANGQTEHTICTSYAGEEFWCDTNYHMTERLTATELRARIEESGAEHVCLTGGEPFIHNLLPLCQELYQYSIHIETSGTIPIPEWAVGCWITCSPKKGYLNENWEYIDEWKFVVGPNFDWDQMPRMRLGELVYLSPINNVHTIDEESRKRALDIVMRHPELRLGQQMHKILGVR